MPRSSKTMTCTSRASARCCSPSSATSTSTSAWAAHRPRAASMRRRATHTGARVRRRISSGSSPTSAAALPSSTAAAAWPLRPWPREITPGVQPAARKACTSAMTVGVLPAPPATRLPTTITGTGARMALRQPSAYGARCSADTARQHRLSGHSTQAVALGLSRHQTRARADSMRPDAARATARARPWPRRSVRQSSGAPDRRAVPRRAR